MGWHRGPARCRVNYIQFQKQQIGGSCSHLPGIVSHLQELLFIRIKNGFWEQLLLVQWLPTSTILKDSQQQSACPWTGNAIWCDLYLCQVVMMKLIPHEPTSFLNTFTWHTVNIQRSHHFMVNDLATWTLHPLFVLITLFVPACVFFVMLMYQEIVVFASEQIVWWCWAQVVWFTLLVTAPSYVFNVSNVFPPCMLELLIFLKILLNSPHMKFFFILLIWSLWVHKIVTVKYMTTEDGTSRQNVPQSSFVI